MVVPDVTPPLDIDNPLGIGRRQSRNVGGRLLVGINPLDVDRFFGMPGVNDLPQIGERKSLGGIWAGLANIGTTFLATVMNANSIFRIAICDWAIGVLNGFVISLQSLLTNEAFKKSPLGDMVENLLSIVQNLVGLIKSFGEGHKNNIKGDQQVSQSFNEIGKMA